MDYIARLKQYLVKASFGSEWDRVSALECVAEIEKELVKLNRWGEIIMNTRCMKAYMVHDGDPSEKAVLVFARTAQEARKIGNGWDDIGCDGFLTVRAVRFPGADKFAHPDKGSYVERKTATLRQAGWREEGDYTCGHCGLAEMGGEFPLCEECDACPDCGHADDCPNKIQSEEV
jgi:hypothetical protein